MRVVHVALGESGSNSAERRFRATGNAFGARGGLYTPSDLRLYPTPALSPKTFVARSRTRNRATQALCPAVLWCPQGNSNPESACDYWDSLGLVGTAELRRVPIGTNESQQVPGIWATNRATTSGRDSSAGRERRATTHTQAHEMGQASLPIGKDSPGHSLK